MAQLIFSYKGLGQLCLRYKKAVCVFGTVQKAVACGALKEMGLTQVPCRDIQSPRPTSQAGPVLPY